MTNTTHQPTKFLALEVSLDVIRSLRGPMAVLRRRSPKLATQLEASASSVSANVAEGNRRAGKDRLHLFRVALGSADESATHLRVAEAWGYVSHRDIAESLALLDRQIRLLRGLTK